MEDINKKIILNILNLEIFKVKKCNKNKKHNNIKCVFYHNAKDKRRNFRLLEYNDKICKKNIYCKNKKFCKFSHNKIEILYHPFFYKKKICMNYFNKGTCKFKNFCSFAHLLEELQIKLIHKFKQNYNFFITYFKTEFCPLGDIEHNKKICVYAHNFQDYKRINLNYIIPLKCKNWKNDNFDDYGKNCKNGFYCKFYHGLKEYFYHPIIYKQSDCTSNFEKCYLKKLCYKKHINEFVPNIKYEKCIIPNNFRYY